MYNQLQKDTKWTIINHGQFDIDFIKLECQNYDKEWLIDTSRQDNNVTHHNTNMYQIIYSDYLWQPGTNLDILVVNKLNNLEAEKQLKHIFTSMEKHFNGKVCRAEIIKMSGNTKIRKHVDGGQFLQHARRCHVPIKTNPDVYFTVMDNRLNMLEGVWYEINNSLPHSVENNSNEDRIHLIVDIMPLEML